MSLSSEALLDHIANFLKFISSAQSFWFSLDTSYDHGCHLASRFRLDPDEYEALLIVAGLASYTRFGFQIKAGAWRKFLGGSRFVIDNCAIEFEQKKIDLDAYINGTPPSQLKRKGFYVVRIGNKCEQLPNKIEEEIGWERWLITTPQVIISKNSESIYMDIHFREEYGWRGQGIAVIVVVLVIGVFLCKQKKMFSLKLMLVEKFLQDLGI